MSRRRTSQAVIIIGYEHNYELTLKDGTLLPKVSTTMLSWGEFEKTLIDGDPRIKDITLRETSRVEV